MQNRPVRIQDPRLRDALARLEKFTTTLKRRVAEFHAADERVERTLSVLEADVAARLVHDAAHEVALRLLSHGVQRDAEADVNARLKAYRMARAELEHWYGPVVEA